MTWLAFKAGFCKSWLWLKEHWQIPFLLVWTIVVYVMTRRNSDAMLEVIEAKRDSYKKQIEVLRRSHNKEILKRDGLIEQYEETIAKIEKTYAEEKKELSRREKEIIKEVVVKSKGNIDESKQKIEKEFGLQFME